MKGYNGTIFAYGQTGSGKTYTMSALTEAVLGRLLDAAAGVCATGRKASLALSYYEIYMAKPYDLLSGHAACKMQEDAGGQCHITGLREVSSAWRLASFQPRVALWLGFPPCSPVVLHSTTSS